MIMKHKLFILLLWLTISFVYAVPVKGKTRKWTNTDGKELIGKLIYIDADNVTLKLNGKNFTIATTTLSDSDKAYIKKMTPIPPAGKIEPYEATFKDDIQREYYKNNNILSLAWKGSEPNEKLPFILYSPDPHKHKGKLPIIVHLSGTGGIGTDNVNPLFADGGGIAKTFLSDKLQRRNPCHVMIPQPARIGGWLGASYTEPADNLAWTMHALDHLLNNQAYNIDPDRVYITGLSMGGGGVYHALAKSPNKFAAGIPIAWAEDYKLFHKDNVGSPMWIVLNEGDKGQPVEMVREFRRQYIKLGGDVRVTIYNGGGHDAWSQLLGDQEFKTWLFRRKLGN
jgi:predicted peptidase